MKKSKLLLVFRIVFYIAMLAIFFSHPSWYTNVTDKGVYVAKKMILAAIFSSALMIVLPCIKFRTKLSQPLYLIIVFFEILISLLMTLYLCEQVHGVNYFKMRTMPVRYNLWIAFAIFLTFFAITGLRKLSLFLTFILANGFSVLNFCVYQFRGDPVTAADVFVVDTALTVAGNYKIPFTMPMLAIIFGGVSLIIILCCTPKQIKIRRKIRVLSSALFLVFSISTFYLMAMTSFPENKGVNFMWFNTMKRYRTAGELLYFIHGFSSINVKTPVGYSSDKIEEWSKNSGLVSDAASDAEGKTLPNIIVIMNESLTDFTSYSQVLPSDDPFKFIHSLDEKKNSTLGNLHVDVFGGQTANSEYEFLTGNSMVFLPSSATAYILFVRDNQPSFSWNLRDLGYGGNIAFHPYKRNNYNRPRAYSFLGFETYYSGDEIKERLNKTDYLRKYVSDSADFGIITEAYEQLRKDSEAPFYLYNVTMQNHNPFDTKYENLKEDITISGDFAEDDQLVQFINLASHTDRAFKELTDYFSSVNEPTAIIMFGDHQPKLHSSTYKNLYGKNIDDLEGEEQFQRYVTPLVIWANYDINEDASLDDVFENISLNYLSSTLAQALDLPMTAQQKFLAKMRKSIPIFTIHGYYDSSGVYYENDDEDSPWRELIEQYQYLEYNYQFDKKNRLDELFNLQSESPSIQSSQ